MGTDRILIHDGPCNCGQGRYVVNECTPDHPYPTSSIWWEREITCERCRKIYELDVRAGKVVQVRKSDIEARNRLNRCYEQARNRVMERALPYMDALLDRVSEMRSKAEMWRFLNSVSPYSFGTEGTFRKHLKAVGDIRKLAERNIGVYDLPRVLEKLEREDEELLGQIREIHQLHEDAHQAVPAEIVPN